MSAAAEQLAEALDGRRSGDGWTAKCPAHDDHKPSLSINDGNNGHPVVFCHAGCEQTAVIDALRVRHLWSSNHSDGDVIPTVHPTLGAYHSHWDYYDTSGRHVARVCRWETTSGKEIRPLTLQSGRWVWKHFEADRPLYRLRALLTEPSKRVLLVEGEKTADAAHKYFGTEFIVTTWSGGAKATSRTNFTPLAGRDVTLMPDNDDAGRKAMNDVAAILQAQGCAVRLVDLSGMDLGDGWDIADALQDRDVDLDAILDAITKATPRSATPPNASTSTAYEADLRVRPAERRRAGGVSRRRLI